MNFPEFYKELEAEFLGGSAKLMGLQLLQLEIRLGKNPSRSFRHVKSAKILWQFSASCSLRVSLDHDVTGPGIVELEVPFSFVVVRDTGLKELPFSINLIEYSLEFERIIQKTRGGRGGESFWEGGDDFGVDVLRFHTCLTDILGFLEKWINEGEGKITVWEQLVEKFFYRFYPDSYDGEEEMLDERDNWGIDPLEFISRVNSSFDKHMKMDGRTKKVLFHAWINGNWNKRRMDDNILSSNNTTTDLFFKSYLITSDKNETEKDNELSQTKRKCSNTSNSIDEQPYKRICKAEKFEAIKYSLPPNEEYIAIRRCEYNAWERNKDRMSIIYQEIFQKKDNGWKVTRTE
ncbi:hypothetical protein Tco_1284695 [Tanacetum coccineum]